MEAGANGSVGKELPLLHMLIAFITFIMPPPLGNSNNLPY
jgi:hypothetical protein